MSITMIVYRDKTIEIHLASERPGGWQQHSQEFFGGPRVKTDMSTYEVSEVLLKKPQNSSAHIRELAQIHNPIMRVVSFLDTLFEKE